MRGIAALPSVRWPLRRSSREEARLLARNDGSPRPDGVFRPEAERKIRAGLIEGIRQHNAEPKADAECHAPGERPYADTAASQLAAYRFAAASERTGPQPKYHPMAGAAPVTAPLPVLAGNAKVPPPPGPAPRPVRPADPETALLARVHAAMVRKWHAETFLADKRELPCFDATTKELGWQGLHMVPQAAGWRRWSTGPWATRERDLANAALARARAELEAVHARYAAEAVVEGGSR